MQKRLFSMLLTFVLAVSMLAPISSASAAEISGELKLGGSVSGAMKGAEEKWYTFNVAEKGLVNFTIETTGKSMYGIKVDIFSSDGVTRIQGAGVSQNAITKDYSGEFFTPLLSGNYNMRVTSGIFADGNFKLTAEKREAEYGDISNANETSETANILTLNTPSIGYVGAYQDNGKRSPDGWFKFTNAREGIITLNFVSNGYPNMNLYNSDGTKSIAYSSSKKNSLTDEWEGEVSVNLLKGDFFIRISSYNSIRSASYKLTATQSSSKYGDEPEPNESPQTALILPISQTVGGTLGGFASDGTRDAADWYQITVAQDGKYTFMTSAEMSGTVRIYGMDGSKRIASESNSSKNPLTTTYDKQWETDLTAGTYYVAAESGSAGWYWIGFTEYGKSLSAPDGQTTGQRQDGSNTTPNLSLSPIQDESNKSALVGVKLTWNPVSGITRYRIYRSTSPGSQGEMIADNVQGTSYVDLQIAPNTSYYYTIAAISPDGTVSPEGSSTEKSFTVNDTAIPQLPDANGNLGAAKSYILMQIDNPKMDVNGVSVELDPGRGTAPVLRRDRTMLPIRAVTEAMKGTVDWNASERKATLNANGNRVEMWIDRTDLTVNSQSKSMDVAPFIENERTLLPLRFVAENLNSHVTWINDTREILIVFNG